MSAVAPLSPVVPKPAHVPDTLVYDFDMFRDPAYVADPHERVLDLVRRAPPIFWTPRNGGHWMLLSHSANFHAARDTESFSSEFIKRDEMAAMRARLPPGMPHIPLPVPINVDPPEHSKYRAPLQRVFSPKSILNIKDSITALASELVDRVRGRGNCEFMKEIAEPMPVRVFLKLLGLPLERQDEYRAIVSQHLSDPSPDPRAFIPKLQRIAASMHDTFLARREHPQDDIISLLWKIDIDGRPTTLADMENYGVLLFIAGLDTVMNGIGHGVRHLARNPALQAQLRADPKLVPEATEEMLRRYTFTIPPRIVGKDVVFEGVQMKAGERAMLFLPAADLDPKEFAKSDEYDLSRENKVHIAFNAGPHRCLGSHLARVELQVIYEVLTSRLPPFRLDPTRAPTFHCGHVVGVDSLHLLWDVG